MPRYIDAEQVKLTLINQIQGASGDTAAQIWLSIAKRIVELQPTADVEEVRHGEWIVEDAGGGWKRAICPRCDKIFLYAKGQLQIHAMPRCPNCGAKMDGGAEA